MSGMEVDDDQQQQKQEQQENQQPVPIRLEFPAMQQNGGQVKQGYARVPVPPHRYTPLRNSWQDIYEPIVNHMKLQIRFNQQRRCVEIKTSEHTKSPTALTKSADFVRAFMLGFEVKDAISLLRIDDLFVDSFEVKDVKSLQGDHQARAIGRIAGHEGKTKYTIENATTTRIVVADTHIHILGSYANIRTAKRAIVDLILGSSPGKVYTRMRAVASHNKQKF